MPPRASKRGASAKKPPTRSKKVTPEPKPEVVPSGVVEEIKVSESEVQSSPVEDNKIQEAEVPKIVAKEKEIKKEDAVLMEKDPKGEVVSSSIDQEKIVVKEEILETTVVVEESTVVEETIVESKVVVETVEESKVVEEEVKESKVVEGVLEEESKVVEGVVEEENVEIASSNATLEVEVEEKKAEIVSLDDVSEVEMKESMLEEDPEEMEAEENANEGDQMDLDQVSKQDTVEKVTTSAAEVEETVEGGDGDEPTCADEGGNEEGEDDKSGSDDEDNEEDDDPTGYMQFPLTDRKKQKELEIFVGGLDKEAVEEDLIKVFGVFGEIQAVRIVKHPTTHKSKGFAFIRYASVEQAKKVLAELKDGTEVRGKRVGISPSKDSDTLYVGNICKTWSKDQVLEILKTFGIDQIEEIYLPDDPKKEGQGRGFALLEFSTHSDAMAAFQRLRKPDAVFGCDRSAKVSFAQSAINPSEVKTVFVEGLTESWDEEKLKEFCKQYGEIERVQLSRNLITTRRKDFGFVCFTSRESATACVEGINSAQIGEGDVKVKANLAKPQYRGRLGKQAARGGYKIKKDGTEEAGSSKMTSHAKSRGAEGKGKALPKSRSVKGGNKPYKAQVSVSERQGAGAPFRNDRQRKEQPPRGGKRGGRSMDTSYHGRPSKKQRGNMHGRPTNDFGNRRNNSYYGKARQNHHGVAPARYVDPYAQGYAAHAPAPVPASSYQGHAYGAHPGSKRRYSDMEPHAGYLEPATVSQSRDPYNYGMRRATSGYDVQGSSSTVYAGGSVVQPSYVPSYPTYTAYGSGGSGSGSGSGYVYPSSGGAYPPQQTYY